MQIPYNFKAYMSLSAKSGLGGRLVGVKTKTEDSLFASSSLSLEMTMKLSISQQKKLDLTRIEEDLIDGEDGLGMHRTRGKQVSICACVVGYVKGNGRHETDPQSSP